jgi:hypothetical protein
MFAYFELRRFYEELVRHSEVFSFAGASEAGRVGTPRTTIMRHDVDIDVEAAVAMAGIEAEYGISSTFFFLTGCDTYNVASAANRRHLRRLTEQGFEVALHFDPLLYPELGDGELLPAARREADWLAEIAGQPVRSLSLHNPSMHGRYPAFEGFANAYDPLFFDPDFYLSDSCMSFRGKDPFEFVRRAERHGLQILLHPFHYSETGGGYPEGYRQYFERLAARIGETMKVNPAFVSQTDGRSLFGGS